MSDEKSSAAVSVASAVLREVGIASLDGVPLMAWQQAVRVVHEALDAVRAEERAARSILEVEHRAHCERLTAERDALNREAAEHLAHRRHSARLLDAIFAAGLDPRNPPRIESHEAPETAYARALIERLKGQ